MACGKGRTSNMLVFSLGHDSPFWMAINGNGTTRFIENSRDWMLLQPPAVQASTVLVQYSILMPQADALVCDPAQLLRWLDAQLPSDVRKACWDIILVDGPMGMEGGFDQKFGWLPGRMQSIYAARTLAHPNTVVYTDDCERRVESMYTLRCLERSGSHLQIFDNGHGGFTCRVFPGG